MKISFCHNWGGKLDAKKFTTIRRNPYWLDKRGEIHVYLNGSFYAKRKLKDVIRVPFGTIDRSVVEADTGLSYPEALRVFENFKINEDTMVCILFFFE